MIVIMGASGNIGSKLAQILLGKGKKIKVLGRSTERLAPLIELGAEPAIGDVSDKDYLSKAFKGAQVVFAMIPPAYTANNFRAYYNEIGDNIVKSIQKAGVQHVLFLSSHGAHLPDKTGPIKGLYDVEQKLNQLEDVHVLHLRPTYFMENLLANIGMIKNMGINGGAIKGHVKFAMIATKDIAAVAANHLLKKDFSGKSIHELLGQRDLSMQDVTKVFGAKVGKPDLKYVEFPEEEAKTAMMEMGMSDDASNQLVELNQAINDGIIAVDQKRTTHNTTKTSIEEFANFFARIYEHS
jgi:uncharacterized protein YbjT (DUF2867 family)